MQKSLCFDWLVAFGLVDQFMQFEITGNNVFLNRCRVSHKISYNPDKKPNLN